MRNFTKIIGFVLTLFIGVNTAVAQQSVGVGTNTPDVSARLDINASDKGLLIPKVFLLSLSDAVTVTTPANGLMLFNTNKTLTGGTGFYYNSGTSAVPVWTKFQTGASAGSGWGLTGNAATDSTTNFIGTTDVKPLVFRLNNLYAGQLGANGGIALGRGANETSRITPGGVIAIGDSALFNNTDSSNIAIGEAALYGNVNGSSNTAIGNLSMANGTMAFGNVAVGNFTLTLNDSSFNTAVGFAALNSNQEGDNTAIGALALTSNLGGFYNSAVGSNALFSNDYGFANSSVGAYSLINNLDGAYNNAIGFQSMFSNTSGTRNNAIGNNALVNNSTGSYNVAVGRASLTTNSTGNGNTAIGNKALSTNNSGNFNTAIGDSAFADAGATAFNNSTAIGYQANIIASNTIVLGNTSITSIKGQVGFSTFSDGRYKKDVVEDIKGLAFVMQLRPVSYHYNFEKIRADRFNNTITNNDDDGIKSFTPTSKFSRLNFKNKLSGHNSFKISQLHTGISTAAMPDLTAYYNEVKQNDQIRYTGFIAQEVEAAAKKSGFDFSGVDKPKNENDQYALRYAEFVVPLVKAVQEQQAIIDAQNKKIEDLIKRLEKLEQK
jgi:hypothetical protein